MEADRGTAFVAKSKSVVLLLVAISVGVVLGWVILFLEWPHWHWEDLPVHGAVEAAGAVTALFMGVILLSQRRAYGRRTRLWVGTGFLGMGILDGFHSLTMPGEDFVFLHCVAGLVGSICFALAWLPATRREVNGKMFLPWVVVAGSVTCGLWVTLFRGSVPAMLVDGRFNTVAMTLNLLTSFFFLAASLRLGMMFLRSGELELYLFACMSLLFGLAGLEFIHSSIWDGEWWFWHFLRLLSYLLILWFLEREYQSTLKELRESEGRFRGLTESTSDWIWEVDENSRYTYASPKVKDLLGYEPAEVIGRTPFELMPQEEAERVAGQFSNIVKARRHFPALENMNRHADGHLVLLETSGVPVFGERGEFQGYRGIDRDITERKRTELELRSSQHELQVRNRIAQAWLSTSDEEDSFHETLDVLLEALESPHGLIGYIDDGGNLVFPTMTRDVWEKCHMSEKSIFFPPEDWGGIWGRALKEQRTLCPFCEPHPG